MKPRSALTSCAPVPPQFQSAVYEPGGAEVESHDELFVFVSPGGVNASEGAVPCAYDTMTIDPSGYLIARPELRRTAQLWAEAFVTVAVATTDWPARYVDRSSVKMVR